VSLYPFVAQANTVAALPGTTAAAIAIPGPGTGVGGTTVPAQVLVFNNTSGVVYVAFGNSSVVATIPVVGTPGNGVPINVGQAIKFSVVSNGPLYVSTIASAIVTGNIYFTPGDGV
jgi:hypothetical protein